MKFYLQNSLHNTVKNIFLTKEIIVDLFIKFVCLFSLLYNIELQMYFPIPALHNAHNGYQILCSSWGMLSWTHESPTRACYTLNPIVFVFSFIVFLPTINTFIFFPSPVTFIKVCRYKFQQYQFSSDSFFFCSFFFLSVFVFPPLSYWFHYFPLVSSFPFLPLSSL